MKRENLPVIAFFTTLLCAALLFVAMKFNYERLGFFAMIGIVISIGVKIVNWFYESKMKTK